MSNVDKNISNIIIPFVYKGKNIYEEIEKDLKNNNITFNQVDFINTLFLGYIEAIYKKTKILNIEGFSDKVNKLQLVLFETGIGFLVFRYAFENDEGVLSVQDNEITLILHDIKTGTHELLNTIMTAVPNATFFPASAEKNALTLNLVISKIGKKENCSFLSESEQVYQIDKMHEVYYSSNALSIVTNQHYGVLCSKDEDIIAEQKFRAKFENAMLYIFLLLQHERKAYLIYREQVIIAKSSKKKTISFIKKEIMDLLSFYSFTVISENVEMQHIYSEYRNVLNLSEYESTLGDLIFRLDDEIGKAKENKITLISLLIAIFGLFQLISVVLDIISCF